MIKKFLKTISPDKIIGSDYEKVGIGGFMFYVVTAESATKTATITANPVEDGSTVNDHIIRNPATITISGEVADVFIESPIKPLTIQKLVPAIGIIQDYLPQRTTTQISKINGLLASVDDYFIAADTAIKKGTQLFDYFKNKQAKATKTATFLEFFDTIYESNSVIDVECIDKVFENMAITSFSTAKLNPNNYSFTISLQTIVTAETTVIQLTKNASGDATAQGASTTNKGTQQTTEVDESFASALIGALS